MGIRTNTMIKFRQKIFANPSKWKKFRKWAEEKIKDTNPLMLGVSTAGAGLGVANVVINKQRRDADIKLREDQIKATNELTEVLHKIEALEKKEAKKHSRKLKKAFQRDIPEIEYPAIGQKQAEAVIKKFRKKGDDKV